MRFFIALELSAENKAELEIVQNRIKDLLPQAKLTDSDKLHLTIAFVGEQPEDLKDDLVKILQDSVTNIPPFAVLPSHLDGFPHLHSARILWIGVKGDTDKLFILRHHIKDKLIELGLPVDERRYIPHIAIAKFSKFKLKPFQEEELEKIMKENFTPIKVNSIKLFESIPDHGFHSHNTLAEINLH